MDPGKQAAGHAFFGLPHHALAAGQPQAIFPQPWPAAVAQANPLFLHHHHHPAMAVAPGGPALGHVDHQRQVLTANPSLQRIVKSPEAQRVHEDSEYDDQSSVSDAGGAAGGTRGGGGGGKRSRREDDAQSEDDDRTRKRREQIAAASRASRLRRKRELEDLRSETKQLKSEREALLDNVKKLQKRVDDLQVRPLILQEMDKNASAGGVAPSRSPNVLRELSRSLFSVTALLTQLRDKDCAPAAYVHYSDRLCRILAEEAIASCKLMVSTSVTTPTRAEAHGLQYPEFDKECCVVSIMRSGDILADAIRHVVPSAPIGKFLIQRQEDSPDKHAVLHWSKLPHDIAKRFIFLCDPMLGTGGSATLCIQELVKCGVLPRNILFLNVISCPEGLKRLAEAFPDVQVVTCHVDDHLNEQMYIVPGLGDFGDRYYHTSPPAT